MEKETTDRETECDPEREVLMELESSVLRGREVWDQQAGGCGQRRSRWDL